MVRPITVTDFYHPLKDRARFEAEVDRIKRNTAAAKKRVKACKVKVIEPKIQPVLND